MMILPYVADIGCILIKSLKNNLQRALPVNIQTCLVHTGTKLSSQLRNIKIPHHWKSNVIMYITPFVVLKTVMRITSWKCTTVRWKMKDHNGRDRNNSYLFNHSVESRHDPALKNNFRIIGKGYRNNARRRKIADM